jgi:hypothetical protein
MCFFHRFFCSSFSSSLHLSSSFQADEKKLGRHGFRHETIERTLERLRNLKLKAPTISLSPDRNRPTDDELTAIQTASASSK